MYAVDAVRPHLRRLLHRAARPVRIVTQAVSLVIGSVLATSGEPTGDKTLYRYAGVLLLASGPLLPLWRAPERDAPSPIRLRRILHRAAWRTAVVLAAGAWTAGLAGMPVLGWSLAAAAAVPPATEPWAWLLFPAEVRRAATAARAMEELQKGFTAPSAFHPEQGAAGRPAGIRTRPKHAAPHKSLRTLSPRSSLGYPALLWTGTRLVVLNKRGRPRPVPTACTEIVHVREISGSRTKSPYRQPGDTRALYLLDRHGYRLARIPGPWPARDRVETVTHAAGLLFSAYDLTAYAEHARLTRLLFPYRHPHLLCRCRA